MEIKGNDLNPLPIHFLVVQSSFKKFTKKTHKSDKWNSVPAHVIRLQTPSLYETINLVVIGGGGVMVGDRCVYFGCLSCSQTHCLSCCASSCFSHWIKSLTPSYMV